MRRLVTLITLATLLGPTVGAAQAARVCPVDEPAPAVGVPLTWRGPNGDTEGVWFPDAKVVRIEQRLTGCEDKLGTCAFDLKVAQAKANMPVWVWVVAGGVVGVGLGFAAGIGWKAATK